MSDVYGKANFNKKKIKCQQMGYTKLCHHDPDLTKQSIEWKY